MKKRLYLITTFLASAAVLSLSSCLKDNRYVDFSKVGTIVEFPLGGALNFGADAITEAPDTDVNGTITRQFAVNVASPTAPSTASKITLSVDNSIVTAYNATESIVNYLPMPTNAFVFTATSITIPAGQRTAIVSVTFYKNLLDPSKSYMLPIKIASAGGLNISGNKGIHYYHFIGNDFAGAYEQIFRRWNATDSISAGLNGNSFGPSPVTFFPVSPTEFTVKSGYAASLVSYDVSFTKNSDGTYSGFTVQILPSDIAVLTANSITLTQQPVFLAPPNQASYTYAAALKLFNFQWIATTTAPRYLVDEYYK